MLQRAILLNKNNAAAIVETLDEYDSVEDFIEDYKYMLNLHGTVVLVKDTISTGFSSVSYVVTRSTFEANNGPVPLSTTSFTTLSRF